MASWWDEMERRIRARGVRVDERLALLALLRKPEPGVRLAAETSRLRQAVEDAVSAVRAEALRGETRPDGASPGPKGGA